MGHDVMRWGTMGCDFGTMGRWERAELGAVRKHNAGGKKLRCDAVVCFSAHARELEFREARRDGKSCAALLWHATCEAKRMAKLGDRLDELTELLVQRREYISGLSQI